MRLSARLLRGRARRATLTADDLKCDARGGITLAALDLVAETVATGGAAVSARA